MYNSTLNATWVILNCCVSCSHCKCRLAPKFQYFIRELRYILVILGLQHFNNIPITSLFSVPSMVLVLLASNMLFATMNIHRWLCQSIMFTLALIPFMDIEDMVKDTLPLLLSSNEMNVKLVNDNLVTFKVVRLPS